MQELSVSSNHGSNAYGQDVGGGVLLGGILKATVVEKLDQNLYLLQVGKNTIEAHVVADLQEGTEYRFIVERGGQPPELALVNGSNDGRPLANGLTPEENAWIVRLANFMGREEGSYNPKELLQLIRAFGFNIDASPEQVFRQLESVLRLMPTIDSAPPAVRHMMAQTLLFTMYQGQQSETGQTWFEDAVRLAGEVPRWSRAEADQLLQLKDAISRLPAEQGSRLRSLLLGLSRGNLEAELRPLVAQMVGPDGDPETLLRSIVNDPVKRLFLAHQQRPMGMNFSGSLERSEAIQTFQQQAPGLSSSSITNLLEQYTAQGGALEKLSYGDLVAAQLSWRGATPSAMQVHRTGVVMTLSQGLPADMRNLQISDLVHRAPGDRMPVMMDPNISSDPASSSLSLSRLQEFSHQESLPNTYHVDRFLQHWNQSGGSLPELRSHLNSIHEWNRFIENHPELRSALAEHLTQRPAFVPRGASLVQPNMSVTPETQNAFMNSLSEGGVDLKAVPRKEIQAALQAVQQVSGDGQAPHRAALATATWLLGKGIPVDANNLQALMQFQQGHLEAMSLLQDVRAVQDQLQNVSPELNRQGEAALFQAGQDAKQLKEVFSFYQKGNGAQLRQWVERALELLQLNPQRNAQLINTMMMLQHRLGAHEEFLGALKHYNLFAQRQDTPQLYEIPVSFGDLQEKALLRVYHKDQGQNQGEGGERNVRVVIDLNLEGLGKVRSEVTLFNQHLQLDFTSPNGSSIEALKSGAANLLARLEEKELKANLNYKVKPIQLEDLTNQAKSQVAPTEKANIDASA